MPGVRVFLLATGVSMKQTQDHITAGRRTGRLFLLIFLLLAAGIIGVAIVFHPHHEYLLAYIAWVAVLLFAAGASVGMLWRQQRVLFYRNQLKAEALVKHSEQNYQALFENMQDGFAYCQMLFDERHQPVDFIYLAVNKAFGQLTGLQNVVGKKVSEVIPGIRETSPELFAAYGRVALTGQPERFEFDFKSLQQWLSISVYSPAQGHFVAVFDNITARKHAEAAVRESQTKLAAALEAMTDAVLISDVSGQFLEVNDAFATFHRFKSKAECAKRLADYPDFLEVFLPDGTLAPLEQWAVPRALRGETAVMAEYKLRRKDTGESWYGSYSFAPIRNAEGAITGAVVVGRDITFRKRVELELKESERRLQFALETIQTGAWDLNLVDHTAHRTLLHDQIFGYAKLLPEWTYEMFLGHVLPEDRGEVDRKFREAVATQSKWSFECRIRRTDGVVRWIFAAGDHEINAAGKPVKMSGIVQDITDRKLAALELQERNAELERFLYTVSHDLKSPVVTVRTFLGYLEQDLAAANAERSQKDLLYIRNAAEKMGRLLDDVLDISRVGRVVGAPVRVAFRTLVDEALQAVAGRIAERGVQVQVSAADVQLCGDRLRLGEIWQNLVENAVKFMGAQAAPQIEIGWEQRGAERVFFVRDNGIGIDPRFQNKVFGLFEKLDPKAEGTGIGLALVKRIVDLHGGRIWVESAGLGQGSCFSFTLPETVHEPKEGTKL